MPQIQLQLDFPENNKHLIKDLMAKQRQITGTNFIRFAYILKYIKENPNHNLRVGNDGLIRDGNRPSPYGIEYII